MPLNRRTSTLSILDQFPHSTIRESVGPQSHSHPSQVVGSQESHLNADVRSSGRLIGG
eukprot:COSAG02_NODE_1696_length_11261_cov_132.993639_12_plen_58_part_00